MRIKVYLDEDVPASLAQALLNRSVDILTTQDTSNKGLSDADQLLFAVKSQRTIFTHNRKDFILLHTDYLKRGNQHFGIIVSDQLPTGMLLRRFMKLWFSLSSSDMKNRLEFMSNWK